MTKPFAASKIKLNRANQHIAELKRVLDQYFVGNPPSIAYTAAADPDVQFSLNAVGPPECVGAIVGDVVHNLRAALNLMAVELVEMNGGAATNTKGVCFPFCDHADNLDSMIKRRHFHRAGIEAVRLLQEIKPFTGGNAALRALHDLDIQDKHNSLIPNVLTMTSQEFTVDWSIPSPVFQVVEGSTPSFTVVFPDESPLAGSEIVPALHELVELVIGILEKFAILPRS